MNRVYKVLEKMKEMVVIKGEIEVNFEGRLRKIEVNVENGENSYRNWKCWGFEDVCMVVRKGFFF